ncbi:MAG: ribonuclease P protein component [Pseudomonadota bacterium]
MVCCDKQLTGCSKPLTFSKSQRLLNAEHFDHVFAKVQWRGSHRHCLILARSNNKGVPRLGLIIAKKHVRKAVSRNRIKRLIRENFRSWQHQLPAIDAIVLARKGMDQLSHSDLQATMNLLWQNLQKSLQQNTKQAKRKKA